MDATKKYPTIACCGIDCGLCPRYYTNGDSRCPGCGGANFHAKRGTCGHFTCCTERKGLEICAECSDYPCQRFEVEKIGCDSFVTHKRMLANLEYIKSNGLEHFLEKQKIRIDILEYLLANHDDGRAKGFFCISCALIPIDKLQEIRELAQSLINTATLKERCKIIRMEITKISESLNIKLQLEKKKR